MTTLAAPEVLTRCRRLVQPALQEAVGRLHPWVSEMAAYSFGWCEVGGALAVASGGKGVRQALAVLGAEAAGAPGRAGVPAAVAVELVHVFSLLHDDIMDGDPARRGRPTVWKAYGTGPAVLAGDALFALAVETLAGAGSDAVRLLSAALSDLVRGQADDLLFATRPWTGPERVRPGEYRAMAEHKTGALLGCAAALGALLGGAPPATVAALDRAGRHLGSRSRSSTTSWGSGATLWSRASPCTAICGSGRRPSRYWPRSTHRQLRRRVWRGSWSRTDPCRRWRTWSRSAADGRPPSPRPAVG